MSPIDPFLQGFAFKSDPVPDWNSLVYSMSLLVFYGLKFDATTGADLAFGSI